jgi:hypothetical protein
MPAPLDDRRIPDDVRTELLKAGIMAVAFANLVTDVAGICDKLEEEGHPLGDELHAVVIRCQQRLHSNGVLLPWGS